MAEFGFAAYAARLASEQGRSAMIPVIEKEIIHYEVLDSLEKSGVLSRLSFQGGTCLRLCYDGIRYSEDLDFSAGEQFDSIDFEKATAEITRSLESRFDVKVRAGQPVREDIGYGVGIKRWWIVVDTMPARPDIPSQRVKVEVASVPSHTRVVRRLSLHYPSLPQSYSLVMVVCQSPEEILADKLVAFANAVDRIRYRDLWDIPWLSSRPGFDRSAIAGLVRLKHVDYRCGEPLPDLLGRGVARAREHVRSNAFLGEMRRFIPSDVLARTLERPDYLALMEGDIVDAYRLAAEGAVVET